MSLAELLPSLRALPRADKLRAIHLLVDEIGREETEQLLPGAVYPVWTPLEAYEAASVLQALILNPLTETTQRPLLVG